MPDLVMVEPRTPRTPPVAVSSGSTEANRTGSWKYIRPRYQDRVAPCGAGCPVGVDIEGYMALLREGRVEEAADVLLRESPMPAVTGRVCNHPCETACSRTALDEPVAIHAVERALGDHVLAGPLPEALAPRHRERVAVVGSGPAGLACGYHLLRMGYTVEVLEQAEKAGGMLRQGIPAYRLPRDLLDRQLDWLSALGLHLRTGVRVGREVTWGELEEQFDAVFVGTGAPVGRRLGVPGEELAGVRQGLAFLQAVNGGRAVEVGRRVVVIGGGNTAMDCARTALRLGAEVTVAYRRTRAEMPAIADEVEEAEREGVRFSFLAAPLEFAGEGGALRSAAFTPMRLGEPDASGRRRPVPTGEKAFSVPADTVLLATGEDVEVVVLPTRLVAGGAVGVDEWGRTAVPTLFAGGDAAGEERTVARALGAGKRAALAIDRALRERRGEEATALEIEALRYGATGNVSATRWLGDDPVPRVDAVNEVVAPEAINLNHFQRVPRHRDDLRAGSGGAGDFAEVNRGVGAEAALQEAARCFNCGTCNECELCVIYCGDVAIHRSGNGARFEIDLEHCKGCGVCAAECPRGAITMTREGL